LGERAWVVDASGLFCCRSIEYQVNITEHYCNRDELVVAILRQTTGDETGSDLCCTATRIGAYGKYRTVSVYTPSALNFRADLLHYLVKTVLETIYTWMEEQIRKRAREESAGLGNELYWYSRTLFLNRAIWRELWFAAMTRGHGFRLFDEVVVTSAFDVVQKNASRFGRGTNDLVAEILKTSLPVLY
jgi:hypothetical protein